MRTFLEGTSSVVGSNPLKVMCVRAGEQPTKQLRQAPKRQAVAVPEHLMVRRTRKKQGRGVRRRRVVRWRRHSKKGGMMLSKGLAVFSDTRRKWNGSGIHSVECGECNVIWSETMRCSSLWMSS